MPPMGPPPSADVCMGLCRRFGDQSCLASLQACVADAAAKDPPVAKLQPAPSVPPPVVEPAAPVASAPPEPPASIPPEPPATMPAAPPEAAPPVVAEAAPPAPEPVPVEEPAAAASTPPAGLPTKASTGPVSEPKFTESEVATLRTPVPFAEWGELHERGLEWMRWKRDEAVKNDPTLAPSPETASDLRLWRFLVATSFKAGEAAKMYIEALEWRKEHKTDEVRAALLAANPAFFGGGSSYLEKPHLGEVDLKMMEARPRTFYKKDGERFEPLVDKAGNLVYIEVPSVADPAAVCEIKSEYVEAELRAQELLQLVIDEFSRRSGTMILIFRVLDLAGFSMAPNLFASREVKEGEALVKTAGKEVKDSYPTTTFKNFLANAPAASVAGPIVSALVPKRSRDKTVIKGADFAAELHKFIELDNLPAKLGGSLDDGLQWVGKPKGKKK